MAIITELIKAGKHFSFSFEVTPGLSEESLDNLTVEPLFYSITWHAKGHQNTDLEIGPLRLARVLKEKGKNVLLHMSCDMLRKNFLDRVLKMLQEERICNLFLMLGEQYNAATSDFASTFDLIKYIREHTGGYFCIAVAGSLDCTEEKLQALKGKIQAGADFIITQAFFEPNLFETFLSECQKIEIEVPIVPGIFYFETKKELESFANLCKVKISDNLKQKLAHDTTKQLPEPIGTRITKYIIDDIRKGQIHHVHFFTLNKLDRVSNFVTEHFCK